MAPPLPPLDDAQLRRYARQILLREIGGRGQRALLGATVELDLEPDRAAAVVAAAYLAGAGVGRLLLRGGLAPVTPADTAFLLEPQDVGAPLALALARRIGERTPDVRVDVRADVPEGMPDVPEGMPETMPEGVPSPAGVVRLSLDEPVPWPPLALGAPLASASGASEALGAEPGAACPERWARALWSGGRAATAAIAAVLAAQQRRSP
ncbi:MAG: hypothetical protein IPI49_03805 [Myxococcales bacterium]|nr:hypothetical protein [Myxococcales bacterium]